jgi:hypothetical protein
VVEQFARAGNVFRLKRGRRVGHIDLVVDPEFVARASLKAGYIGRKPAICIAVQRMRLVQQQIDALRRRRP